MRLFVAVPIPQAIQDQLRKLHTSIPTARWVDVANIHITLKFIGEVDQHQATGITSMLRTFQSPAFDIHLQGVGTFPPGNRKPPRVLWVGIHPQPLLAALQRKVESALNALGIPPEDRPFSPHLTLARFKTEKPLSQVDQFLAQHADFKLPSFHVTEFLLMKSQLSPQGAQYSHLAAYPLEGVEDDE